jgi:hypothetical protein
MIAVSVIGFIWLIYRVHTATIDKIIDRLRRRYHRLRWQLYCRTYLRAQWAKVLIACRSVSERRARPHGLPAQLIVSLTSYPPRFPTLPFTLRSLLQQTVRADHVILWIAYQDMPRLPKAVLRLQKAGLKIRATDDLKSYKKIIPALDAFPDAFICTADDEVYYWPSWLEELVRSASPHERVICCHRAHEITRTAQGAFASYRQWNYNTLFRGRSNNLFPTGAGGILYPPGALTHSQADRKAAPICCPHNDDIWLYWMGRRNGAAYQTVGQPRGRDLVTWDGSQECALAFYNVVQSGNDSQIEKIAALYGYPD